MPIWDVAFVPLFGLFVFCLFSEKVWRNLLETWAKRWSRTEGNIFALFLSIPYPRMTHNDCLSKHLRKDQASEQVTSRDFKEFVLNLLHGPKNILIVIHWAQDSQERSAEQDRPLFWPYTQFSSYWLLWEMIILTLLKAWNRSLLMNIRNADSLSLFLQCCIISYIILSGFIQF